MTNRILICAFCFLSMMMCSCGKDTESEKEDGKQMPEGAVPLTDFESFRSGNDWAPCFEKAFRKSDCVFVPKGDYDCSTVEVPSGKTIAGAGSGTVFHPIGTVLFSLKGKYDTGIPILAPIADFSRDITLTSAGKLQKGDDIMIVSQRNCMLREGTEGVNYRSEWVLGRTRKTSVFFGEFDTVASMAGTQITTSNPRIFPDYFSDSSREPVPPTDGFLERSTTSVYRLEMVKNVSLKDFSVVGTASCYRVIACQYAKDCTIQDISFSQGVPCFNTEGDESLSLIHAFSCLRLRVKSCSSHFTKSMQNHIWSLNKVYASFSLYNIFRIISCWESGFDSCSSDCATHAFSITRRSSSLTAICSGNCYIRNCRADRNIWSGVTVQQGVWNTELSGNEVTRSGQGICCGGKSTHIFSNRVSTDLPLTTSYYYTHITSTQNGEEVFWGGTGGIVLNEGYSCGTPDRRTVVENNEIKGFYTGISVRDGYEEKNIFEEGYIDIRNNTGSTLKIGVGVYKNAYNKPVRNLDIHISGNSFRYFEEGKPLYVCDGVTGVVSE